MYMEQLTQALAIADVLNNAAVNNTNSSSAGIDMAKAKRALFIISLSSAGAAGTLDARLNQSANSNFTGNSNIAGTNITQMTTNNTITTLEIRADQLNATSRYVRCTVTGGGNTLNCSIIGLASSGDLSPLNAALDLNSTFISSRKVT